MAEIAASVKAPDWDDGHRNAVPIVAVAGAGRPVPGAPAGDRRRSGLQAPVGRSGPALVHLARRSGGRVERTRGLVTRLPARGFCRSGRRAPPHGPWAPWAMSRAVTTHDPYKDLELLWNKKVCGANNVDCAVPERFRTGLDAGDRHEIVGLSSLHGLPVLGARGRRRDSRSEPGTRPARFPPARRQARDPVGRAGRRRQSESRLVDDLSAEGARRHRAFPHDLGRHLRRGDGFLASRSGAGRKGRAVRRLRAGALEPDDGARARHPRRGRLQRLPLSGRPQSLARQIDGTAYDAGGRQRPAGRLPGSALLPAHRQARQAISRAGPAGQGTRLAA